MRSTAREPGQEWTARSGIRRPRSVGLAARRLPSLLAPLPGRSLASALAGLLSVAFALLLAPEPGLAQSASGCWMGTVGSGAGQIRASLELTRVGEGWDGRVHRMGRAVDSDSLTSASVDGDRVAVEFPSTLGSGSAAFTGTQTGDELTGTIESGDQTLPASFFRVDPTLPEPALELLGYWTGGLYQGTALVLRMGMEFAPAPCGQVMVTVDSPDQGSEEIPVNRVRLAGDSLALDIAAVSGSLRAIWDANADSVIGTWSQGPGSVNMRMGRSDGSVSFDRPQDPEPPFPYQVEEVTYSNEAAGIELSGTLTIPEGSGPFPAALLITGSGAQDRDESVMGHRPFLVIADHLTRNGIAVLRVDDRGVGGSEGDVLEATIEDNVGDALAGVGFLGDRSEVDPDRVGLIGHSEGGWVAPVAVTRSEDIAFVVSLAGPAVTGREIVLTQNRAILEASDVDEETIEQELELLRTIIEIVTTEENADTALSRVREAVDRRLEEMPSGEREEWLAEMGGREAVDAMLRQNTRAMTSTWYRFLLTFDPVPHLESMDVPVLALFGELDLQVPPEQSVPVLEELWADHPDATIRVLPDLNHLFQHAETGLPTEYAQIEETFAPDALEMISEWILERFGD